MDIKAFTRQDDYKLNHGCLIDVLQLFGFENQVTFKAMFVSWKSLKENVRGKKERERERKSKQKEKNEKNERK